MLRPLMLALLGTSFTFLMTALGAATVFFFARKVCERAQGALLGGAFTIQRQGGPGFQPGTIRHACGAVAMQKILA